MGTLKQHFDTHVSATVSDKTPGTGSELSPTIDRASLQHMGGMFDARAENGRMGAAKPDPMRINNRVNGELKT